MGDRRIEEVIEEMHLHIKRKVAGGFAPPEQVVSQATETFYDEVDPSVLRPHAERLTREAIAEHLREQATWPKVTDCDRLDAAFAVGSPGTELEFAL